MTDKEVKTSGLDLMREPFPKHQILRLPKPTKAQTEAVNNDYRKGIRCKECGGWHHPDVVHLDYVGHAALTDRLLDCDPNWNWEPVAFDERGQPLIINGGMWIRLTVCGQSRLGFGDSQGKQGPNAIKEIIGDALRNAAMRFGAALDLWHKGDLHQDDDAPDLERRSQHDGDEVHGLANAIAGAKKQISEADTIDNLRAVFDGLHRDVKAHQEVIAAKDARKAKLQKAQDQLGDGPLADEIPY